MFKTRDAYANWESKYRYGEESPLGTFQRVAKSLASVEKDKKYWYEKFLRTLVRFDAEGNPVGLKATTGGRITANIGTDYKKATLINCYIAAPVRNASIKYEHKSDVTDISYPVRYKTDETPDDLVNIFLTITEQAKTLASEGGYGINFSFIRPRGSLIKGLGIRHPGVIAYMSIWDSVSACIVRGVNDGYVDKIRNHLKDEESLKKDLEEIEKAAARKGAMMAILPCSHPDCEEFIRAKQESGVLTKFNTSVLIDDKFMQAVKDDDYYDQHFNGAVYKRIKARDLYNLIMESCYNRGEPGVLFYDNMDKYNPLSYLGKCDCTNPCFSGSTYLFTKDGCNTFYNYASNGSTLEILQDNRVSFTGINEEGDETWSVDTSKKGYCFNTSSSVFKTKEKAKTVRLKFKTGIDLVVTPDHTMMTEKGPKDAKDLTANKDKVLFCIPDPPSKFEKTSLDDLAYILGFIDADGGVVEDTEKYIVYIDLYDEKLFFKEPIEEIINSLYKKYGKEICLKRNRSISPYYVTENENKVRIASNFIYHLLKDKFNWSNKKDIPDSFFTYSRKHSFASNYISSFFACNGSVLLGNNCKAIRINQSDRPFLEKLQILLLSLGIDSNIYLRKKAGYKKMPDGKGGYKEYYCKTNYELSIAQKFFKSFLKIARVSDFYKFDKVIKNTLTCKPITQRHKKLIDIIEDEDQDVYCLKEDVNRTLIANGYSARRCGEIPGLSTLTTVCLLGSFNLTQYVKIGENKEPYFDFEEYTEDIPVFTRMLDNVCDLTYNPIPSYDWVTKNLRQIGIGINGLGSTLAMLGIPYNSDEAVKFAEKICDIKENLIWQASALLAKEKGTFKAYKKQEFENTHYFKKAPLSPETKKLMKAYGVRNGKTTTAPPLGNSSILCDISSNGIEPIYDLEYERKLICKKWPEGLSEDNIKKVFKERKGKDFKYWEGRYDDRQYYYEPHNRGLCEVVKIRDYGYQWLLDNYPDKDHKKYLVTTKDIDIDDHINVQEAVQKHVNQSVSKTGNLPKNYPFKKFKDLYIKAWEKGLVGFTTYRDGSMESVLSRVEDKKIIRRDIKLPDEFNNGPTKIIKKEGYKFYIHFSYLPEDPKMEFPVVIWIYTNAKYSAEQLRLCNKASRNMEKLAIECKIDSRIIQSTVNKATKDYPHNRLGRMISLCLRHNVPREDILVKLMGIDGDNISTLLTAVRKFLSETLSDGTPLKGLKCEKCGSSDMYIESGCKKCRDCLHQACG